MIRVLTQRDTKGKTDSGTAFRSAATKQSPKHLPKLSPSLCYSALLVLRMIENGLTAGFPGRTTQRDYSLPCESLRLGPKVLVDHERLHEQLQALGIGNTKQYRIDVYSWQVHNLWRQPVFFLCKHFPNTSNEPNAMCSTGARLETTLSSAALV